MGKLVFVLLILFPLFAFAAGETPQKLGTTILLDDGWLGTGWGDATDALTDDGFYAYAYPSGLRFDVGNWERFEIPYDARIHGVQVCAETKISDTCNASNIQIATLVSDNGGTNYSVAKSITGLNNTTWQLLCVGNSGERWEKLSLGPGSFLFYDWRPEHFNNESSFAARFQATWKAPESCGMGHSFSIDVDYVTVKVHYTLPGNPILHSMTRKMRHYGSN